MSSRLLAFLNRYKFTLIYGVMFWVLGGFVLAVPATLIAMITDFAITRKSLQINDEKIRASSGISIAILFFLILIYKNFIYGAVGSDGVNTTAYAWLQWCMSFTDIMASYIPAIDRIAEQLESFRQEGEPQVFRHVFAVFWFVTLIIVPTMYFDLYLWARTMIRNDFYAHRHAKDISQITGKFLNPKLKEPLLFSDDPIRFYFGFLIIFFVAIGSIYGLPFFFKQAYYGPQELSEYLYFRGTYLYAPFVAVMWPFVFVGSIIFNVVGTLRFLKRIKSKIKKQGDS